MNNKNKNHSNSTKEDLHETNIKAWVTFFFFSGSVILFGSWITDNYLTKKWTSQLAESNQLRYSASGETTGEHTLRYAYKRFKYMYDQDRTNKVLLEDAMESGAWYCASMISSIGLTEEARFVDKSRYDSSWFNNQMDSCKRLFPRIDRVCKASNIDSLNYFIDSLSKAIIGDGERKWTEINVYKDKLIKNGETSNTVFLVLYIIGSICIGISFILKKRIEI